MIYELEIKEHSDGLYEWMAVRFSDKINEGWSASLPAVLLSPIRRRLVQASDELAVTGDGIAVGIYPASVIDDDAEKVARDIAAILSYDGCAPSAADQRSQAGSAKSISIAHGNTTVRGRRRGLARRTSHVRGARKRHTNWRAALAQLTGRRY